MTHFSDVPDTLFIPLTARIRILKQFTVYFYDSKALEIEKIISKEFLVKKLSIRILPMFHVIYSFLTVSENVLDYLPNMDKIVRNFIEKKGQCNIVNLGCGLETNY